MKTIRILVTGSRNWTDITALKRSLAWYTTMLSALWRVDPRSIVIVHGACPTGADAHAQAWAEENGLTTEQHPADWNKHGRGAGPIRNSEMVDLGADLCLAFPLPDSRGTVDCMKKAVAANIPTIVNQPEGESFLS